MSRKNRGAAACMPMWHAFVERHALPSKPNENAVLIGTSQRPRRYPGTSGRCRLRPARCPARCPDEAIGRAWSDLADPTQTPSESTPCERGCEVTNSSGNHVAMTSAWSAVGFQSVSSCRISAVHGCGGDGTRAPIAYVDCNAIRYANARNRTCSVIGMVGKDDGTQRVPHASISCTASGMRSPRGKCADAGSSPVRLRSTSGPALRWARDHLTCARGDRRRSAASSAYIQYCQSRARHSRSRSSNVRCCQACRVIGLDCAMTPCSSAWPRLATSCRYRVKTCRTTTALARRVSTDLTIPRCGIRALCSYNQRHRNDRFAVRRCGSIRATGSF